MAALLTFNWTPGPRKLRWLLAVVSFLILSCGLDVEDSTQLSPPVWVQKSLPEEWPERGIDAHESGGIFLEWLPNPSDENVQSYLIFRTEYFDAQDSLGDYELLSILDMRTDDITEYIDRTNNVNRRYYYVIIAENDAGNQSTFSDTLSYIRFGAITAVSLQPNGVDIMLPQDRKVQWTYEDDVALENYTLTILNGENDLILRRQLTPGNYIGGIEYFTIPDTILLLSGDIYKWRVDMGAQYVDGRETAGSESAWATFLYTAP
ncbi:MAG: hypothetical protein K9M55_06330 [Candidatus Marinimicrobia bacterium]|nr:hypothetical protein [Candidatus Neomarinimicrobiota bacterium]MCF7922301.1 hypothetical protein [Candidatus Neomarinimicrobiota bacterium]